MLSIILTWLASNAPALSILGAIAAFAWPVFQFVAVRRKEQEIHEFEAFHRIMKELVSPDGGTQSTWVDRQIAAAFELRNFRRYDEVILRILPALRDHWGTESRMARVVAEIGLTVDHIRRPWNLRGNGMERPGRWG